MPLKSTTASLVIVEMLLALKSSNVNFLVKTPNEILPSVPVSLASLTRLAAGRTPVPSRAAARAIAVAGPTASLVVRPAGPATGAVVRPDTGVRPVGPLAVPTWREARNHRRGRRKEILLVLTAKC